MTQESITKISAEYSALRELLSKRAKIEQTYMKDLTEINTKITMASMRLSAHITITEAQIKETSSAQ